MKTKTFEIRDDGTFVPALAIKLEPNDKRDRYLLSRAGFGSANLIEEQGDYVLLVHLTRVSCEYDPFSWRGGRTMRVAHEHIDENFETLENGAVIDVEYLLGERDEPKESEATS
jgi:hypothetical protein